MNTLRTSRGSSPRSPRFGRRRLIAMALMSLALAACGGNGAMSLTSPGPGAGAPAGGSGGSAPGPGGGLGDGAPMLDCIREDYPCSFDAVALPVIERSLALSDEVAAQLEGGIDIEQVAAFLAAQGDVAEVIVDGPVLAFRLAGGRPVIVDVTGEQEFLASTVPAAMPPSAKPLGPMEPASAAQQRSTLRSIEMSKITGGNNEDRHALVLSPFSYDPAFGNIGDIVADALNGIRGYAGNVTRLATIDELDPQVTVDVLTRLHDYDVIHIDTHGGTLCKEKHASVSAGMAKVDDKKGLCEGGITDFLVQRFHGTAQDLQSIAHPGVVLYRGSVHRSIAVTADFFRHYYPVGLADKVFILASCYTFRPDMADAIAGQRGIFVSWTGPSNYDTTAHTSLSLLHYLGRGLTVGEAYERIPDFVSDDPRTWSSSFEYTPRGEGGDLRIRDLMRVRDNLTGRRVTDSSGIEVMEYPDDGQNDNLELEFTIDGITEEQLAGFYINLTVDNHVIGHLNVRQSGVQVDDFRYRITTPVPLPYDVQEGQVLNLDFWIPLPDLGEDRFVASPAVNGREEPQVGSEWTLMSSATRTAVDFKETVSATVVFEIDPNGDPDARFQFFGVRHGTVNVTREYEDVRGCQYNVSRSITIPAGAANNYLRFDTGSQNLTVTGFGSAPSTVVQASSSCGTVDVNLGGAYFIADETQVSADGVAGGYNSGTTYPTIIQWHLSRTQ